MIQNTKNTEMDFQNNILVLGRDFVQGINDTTIYAKGLYKMNCIKRICL